MDLAKALLILLFFNLFVLITRCCVNCGAGKCLNGKCVCPSGFWGSKCQFGRQSISKSFGYITESKGDYIDDSKLFWLLDSQRSNSSVQLQLDSFATECGWDYLYIYDGKSTLDPLLAALSGDVSRQMNSNNSMARRKIQADSGSMFLYFYSDKHLNDQGFNISYRISNCSSLTCNYHGFCNSAGHCECEDRWTGRSCSKKLCCPGESYNVATKTYNCPREIVGSGCSNEVTARTSHASALQNTIMWIYGGYSFRSGQTDNLLQYNIETNMWQVFSSNSAPGQRYDHTMVYYNKKLFIFGGSTNDGISNELWEFDILTKVWKKVKPANGKYPVAVTGHASVAIANKMYVFMGYSEEKSFFDGVQQFDMDTYEWDIIDSKGALVMGTYGHSAVYDVKSDQIFIHGGYTFLPGKARKRMVSDMLYAFSPVTKQWSIMGRSGNPRMMHSAVILGRLIVVYGGTMHSVTEIISSKCYSNDLLAYNIECKKWSKIDTGELLKSKNRFGHSAVALNRTAYIFGGFDGKMHNDVIPLTIGRCSGYATKKKCLAAPFITNCAWDKIKLHCIEAEQASLLPSSQIELPSCNATAIDCAALASCKNCLSNTANCVWCDTFCAGNRCPNKTKVKETRDVNLCSTSSTMAIICSSLSTCTSCERYHNCTWQFTGSSRSCVYTSALKKNYNASEVCKPYDPSKSSCPKIKSCQECTKLHAIGCMWCQSENKCIEIDSYFPNFPYGQCMEWTTGQTCSKLTCDTQKTCQDCFQIPGCGWCEDQMQTGMGKCMDGGNKGPVLHSNSSKTCPAARWYFMQCPDCQCNGYSQCVNKTVCYNCLNNTAGKNCELCKSGFFGNPLKEGKCKACFCNGHGSGCDSVTGQCICDEIGVTGKQCERCDIKYLGNASNGGHCFYRLLVGFAYNFNRTSKNINFYAIPQSKDQDMHFEIKVKSGSHGYLNFSYTYGKVETYVTWHHRLGSYSKTFSADKYKFSAGKYPFFKVYLYSWSKNIEFNISFDQKPGTLNWLHFLIVFLICFCSLLIILIVIWKLKQQYTNFRFNRQRRVELKEMASRPFANVTVDCGRDMQILNKAEPSQISLESFQRGNIAIASVFIELPRTEEGFTPLGQSGLCIGSTLITQRNRIMLNAQHQLCIFPERRKNRYRNPVDV